MLYLGSNESQNFINSINKFRNSKFEYLKKRKLYSYFYISFKAKGLNLLNIQIFDIDCLISNVSVRLLGPNYI